jgi:hypothetical protein
MGRSIRVHNRACWLNSLISPPLGTTILSEPERSIAVNLTLLAAVVMLITWFLLLFVAQVPSGTIHLLYAAGIVLSARRILVGAPRFVS